jgi:hypothetical protein
MLFVANYSFDYRSKLSRPGGRRFDGKGTIGTRHGGIRFLSTFKTCGCWPDTIFDVFSAIPKQRRIFQYCERRR